MWYKKILPVFKFFLIPSFVDAPLQERMEKEGRENVTLKTVKRESCRMRMKMIPSSDKNPRLSAG